MVVQVSADDFYRFPLPRRRPRAGGIAHRGRRGRLTSTSGSAGPCSRCSAWPATISASPGPTRCSTATSPRSAGGSGTSRTGCGTHRPTTRTGQPRRAKPDIKATPPVSLLGGWYDIVIDETLDSYRRLPEAGRPARLVVGSVEPHVRLQQGHAGRRRGSARLAAGPPDRAWQPPRPAQFPARRRSASTSGRSAALASGKTLPTGRRPAAAARQWHPRADGTLGPEPGDGTSSFRYDPADPTPSVGGPRMDSNASARSPTTRLRPATTCSPSPASHWTPRLTSSARSASGFAHGAAARTSTCSRGCAMSMPAACRGTSATAWCGSAAATGWTALTVPMSATAHRFAAGHRLRVQVSGGAHPRFARNTGTADQIATAVSLVPVDIEISHAAAAISLPVMPAAPQA